MTGSPCTCGLFDLDFRQYKISRRNPLFHGRVLWDTAFNLQGKISLSSRGQKMVQLHSPNARASASGTELLPTRVIRLPVSY